MDARLYSTESGQIIRKIPENEFIIEFGNISWRLSNFQFRILRDFIFRIDGKFYESINKESFYRRKIRIPIKGTNLSILLSKVELTELRKLLSGLPEDFMMNEDIFEALNRVSDDIYERLEKLDHAVLTNVPVHFHLN